MNTKSIRKPLLVGVVVAVLLLAFGLVNESSAPANGDNVFSLQAPPFVGVARAETVSGASLIEDEAGISAYFQASTSINLEDARNAFRTIEAETADYIIGSVPVTDYPESEGVHVYVHTDGWILAYYLADDPVGKIFDWRDYHNTGGADIKTKLEKVLAIVTGEAGVPYFSPTYYDFRYPNATHMMLIAETWSDGNEFTVELPSSFSYYERSWSLLNTGGASSWKLDGENVSGSTGICGWCTGQGTLTAAQLLPDTPHTIRVDDDGGLALIYRES